ncbi:MAG TPA: hypothetical protein VET87_00325 [Rubrivivax sp.]|nr:hypothetical protein [Rubrivivax sp.]
MLDYPVILDAQPEGGFVVTFPDDRLLDLRHASRLDQIEAAARVLGRHLEVRFA